MTFTFNCTGDRRKELVKAISEITGVKAKYLFMPTKAYEIGEYTVNKDGNIECNDGTDASGLIEALSSRGFEPEQIDAEETADAIEEITESNDKVEWFTVTEVDDTESNETQIEPKNTAEENSDDTKLTISLPAELFDERIFANLDQILENHHDLFCHALRTESLTYNKGDEQVNFPWFTLEEDGDAKVYTEFLSGLIRMARDAKRVNKKPCITDNEKFTMRTYLIRMGFNGNEYKKLRKVMSKNLTGNSAFRSGRPAPTDNAANTALRWSARSSPTQTTWKPCRS